MTVILQKAVPLGRYLNGKWVSDLPPHEYERLRQGRMQAQIVKKNPRTLGGSWLSDKVSGRRILTLCEDCWRRYVVRETWWKGMEYEPDWRRFLSNCNGCAKYRVCLRMIPEETMRGVRQSPFNF